MQSASNRSYSIDADWCQDAKYIMNQASLAAALRIQGSFTIEKVVARLHKRRCRAKVETETPLGEDWFLGLQEVGQADSIVSVSAEVVANKSSMKVRTEEGGHTPLTASMWHQVCL